MDSDVSYLTTVTLDYFGETYTDTYESNEPMVEVTPYEWAVLMTNLNLQRWTLQYTVQASDEEYLSLIHISEPTRQEAISYAVFCLKKKNP